MTMKRNLRLASAVGPATREQLAQWAAEHDRKWDRMVRAGALLFGGGLIGATSLATADCTHGFDADACVGVWRGLNADLHGLLPALLGLLACALATLWLWWHYVARANVRLLNPYRPVDVLPGELEALHIAYPGALAYLDAIRHQRRPIVPHDLDVLAMIRQQQQRNQGACP